MEKLKVNTIQIVLSSTQLNKIVFTTKLFDDTISGLCLFCRFERMRIFLCDSLPAGHELRARAVLGAHHRAGAAAHAPQGVVLGPHQCLLDHRQHGACAHRPLDAIIARAQAYWRSIHAVASILLKWRWLDEQTYCRGHARLLGCERVWGHSSTPAED